MDLSTLDTVTRAEEGIEWEVKNPKTKKGTGLFITTKGKDSKCYKTALKETMKKVNEKTTQRDIFEALFIACTSAWRAVERDGDKETACEVTIHGKPVRFGEAALREAIAFAPTIADQGIEIMEERSNFLATASGS